jgi:hypothetical protein
LQEKLSLTPSASDISDDEVKLEKRKEPEHPSRQKGKQPATFSAIKKPSQRTVANWRRDDDDMEPSAKMLALVEQLHIAEGAGDKTIVYSQCLSATFFLSAMVFLIMHWTGTSMLDLLETLLARYGIQNLRYDGKMRSEMRDATLIAFRKAGSPKVILISTRCGGVGLNLTTANRVVK